jgi:hypothetical protein
LTASETATSVCRHCDKPAKWALVAPNGEQPEVHVCSVHLFRGLVSVTEDGWVKVDRLHPNEQEDDHDIDF